LYLKALVISTTTSIVLGKLDNDGVVVDEMAVQLVDSLLSIADILLSKTTILNC
jgi:hypothetical protein